MCDSWEKSQDASGIRELEQLRVLAMYEFDPPLSNQELWTALRTFGNRTEDAYQYLKTSRRHEDSVTIPTSAVILNKSIATYEKEGEKRRLSALSVDNNGTPKKRHKDTNFALLNWENEENCDKETSLATEKDKEVLLTTVDCTKAQQLLLETVEDQVAARQVLRHSEWIHDFWKVLHVLPETEVAMHLNLTVDALTMWLKEAETQDVHDIQTRGTALVVEVAASLPRNVTDGQESIACSLKDQVLSASDEEIAGVVHANNNAANLSAIARANAAKHAIECLSSACKAYMDQLSQFSLSNETSCKEKAHAETALEAVNLKLVRLVDESTGDVTKAERALSDAKERKEARSLQIVQYVQKRHEELVTAGETNASASIQSVIEVWKQNDVEVQALWRYRSESERQVEKSVRALTVAQHALTFHKNLSMLFAKVRERREKTLLDTFKDLEEERASSKARAATALNNLIPMLTHALFNYYEFHSVQQSKAKKELEKQEKALAAHNEYFGDSAPIKKGDIERRIREFEGVTQSSMQMIMEIAEGQQQLWENKHAVLSESVRRVLICEFKALWLQLNGSMRDVVKKFVMAIEGSAGGVVAVESTEAQKAQQEAVSPAFVTTIDLDEQMFPAFTVPAFPNSHNEAVTPYRTAISAIAASNEDSHTSSSPITPKEFDSTSIAMTVSSTTLKPTKSNETMVASSLPQETSSESRKSRHKFAAGSVLYSKVNLGENCTQFVRGVVVKQLDNDMYLIQYDNGDKFSVRSSFLFTKDLMEQNQKAANVTMSHEDMEMEDLEHKSSEGTCNELVLAQYEAQKWKEKYLVEKRRRQKTVRDFLDLVVRTDRKSNEVMDSNGVGGVAISPSLFSPDHTADLLSPTLSSFDFDDDSSEDDSEDIDVQTAETPPSLVERINQESEVNEDGDSGKLDSPDDQHELPLSSSIDLELRKRHSLMHHLNANAPYSRRINRSSTMDSALEAFGGLSQFMDGMNSGDNGQAQQQHLMNRMMYINASSRDLWQARVHRNKVHSVARSSMHLKHEHIFEHFFVTGMVLSDAERHYQPSDLTRYWKPKLLYDFPNNRLDDPPDDTVPDFCFPRGVPLLICTPDQATSIQGVAVSKWFTEFEPLQSHIEASETSGYTFRLTGAKGEVLYGFCIAIMREATAAGDTSGGSDSKSPRASWTPSCRDESSASPSSKGNRMAMTKKMAPMCYCFTSKFPFYRFHFALLRMIVENELEQHRLLSTATGIKTRKDEEFEIILRPRLDLAIEFTIFHEENPRMRESSRDLEKEGRSNLASISTKLNISLIDRRVVLSEDASVRVHRSEDSQLETRKQPSQLRKSLSTDDIGSYNVTNECIMDKPMVKSIDLDQSKEYERVKVGDILEAVDSIATASMSFEQTLKLLKRGNRPMRLRFRRSAMTEQASPPASKRLTHRQCLLTTSVDVLHRARRMKINDPGHWSTARFPTFDFSYQFPERHSDRWSIGVVLRLLTPDKVVEIMAYLLLEKQVVIMSDSPAKVSAICTALLLLLSPFHWQSTYIPLLPSGLLDFLHSPVPFLVGCHPLPETSQWSDVFFYDIDRDSIAVPAVMRHLGPSSMPNGVELCRLLQKAKERFCALRPSGKPWYELSDEQDMIITLTLQEAGIFLRDLGFDISSQDLAASISGK
ncbi:unnamed protein product [Peronospora farinosa]|uniref:UDENN domain-containing protein n=1 Tax=Peronospora farinosa TaxID=134698 RepID=A0AAV0SPJ5_9STRA|nr:unnamed protein product [Peronospora farinosa]